MKIDFKEYPLLIPSIVISVMLFLAIPNLFPYSYYWGVRWIVTAGSIYFFHKTYINKCRILFPIFFVIGIIFNPIFPIHLNKVLWIIIDIIVGAIFLFSNYIIFKKDEK